jgi:ABC-type polysaccharide/polyol phosphate export permease
MSHAFKAAGKDLVDGVRLAPLWGALGWEQTVGRFRRTLLGPFWLSTTLLTMGFALSFVFGGMMGTSWRENFPYVLAGILAWGLVGTGIAEGANMFLNGAGMMQVQRLPLSFHAWLSVFRAFVNFLAQLITYWVVLLLLGLAVIPSWTLILTLPLAFMATLLGGLVAAIPSTRFRDIGLGIGFVIQLLFFLTPIFWHPGKMHGVRGLVVEYNPFTHLVALIRQPLLGHAPSMADWSWGLGWTAGAFVLTYVLIAAFRKRVIFWL